MDNSVFYFFFYGIFIVSFLGIGISWVKTIIKGGSIEVGFDNDMEFDHYGSNNPNHRQSHLNRSPLEAGYDE